MLKIFIISTSIVLLAGCGGDSNDMRDSLLESPVEIYKKAPNEFSATVIANGILALEYEGISTSIQGNREECIKKLKVRKENSKGARMRLDRKKRNQVEDMLKVTEEFCGNPSGFDKWFADEVITKFNNKTYQKLTIDTFTGIDKYTSKGIDREEAKKWKKNGYSSQEAAGWKSVGIIDISTIDEFKKIGVQSYGTLQLWKDAGANSIAKILEWQKIGINNPSELISFQKIGIKDYNVIALWKSAGFDFKEASKWIQVGIDSPKEAIGWSKVCKPSEVEKYIKLGVDSFDEASEWIKVGVYYYDLDEWKKYAKVKTPKDVTRLKKTFRLGNSPNNARVLFSTSGASSIEELFEWADAGITTLSSMMMWIRDGKVHSPQEIVEWNKVGITKPYEVVKLRRKGITSPKEYIKSKNP